MPRREAGVSNFCAHRVNSLALTDIRKYVNMTLEERERLRAGPGVVGRASGQDPRQVRGED